MPTNVLSADNATFDTSFGDWVLYGGLGSRVTTPTPHAGSHALALAPYTEAADLPLGVTPGFPAGHLVTAQAWARQAGSGTTDWGFGLETESYSFFTATSAVVPTTSWQRLGVAFIIGGTGTDTVHVNLGSNGPGTSGDVGYYSDVLIGSEPVNPPTGLGVTDVAGAAQLDWAFGADQWVGFLDDPSHPQTKARLRCRTSVEKSSGGGAFTQVTTVSGSTTTWTDTSAVAGDRYRLRQAIYRDTAGTGPIRGYSDYTPIVTFGAVGGWGVGQIRMGA